MRNSAIAVSGLRKAYGDKTVLDGIDLDVRAGTVFSLLGPNGAGKTTTVNVLTTLMKADGGTVRVAGHDVATEARAVRAVIGVTGQFAAVAVRPPLDQPFRQCLPQPGNQALQGIRRVGGRALTPNPVDERRLRDCVTWFEREGDQQPAQPRARHVGENAVVRASLEGSKHPDLHLADFATGDGQASDWRRGAKKLPR